ncbi:MAG: type IV pilus assembly protein PilM [Candidatus Gottesmanbacteria bacterium]|nr:type IV pilus assembly protein PilM [Candidatus Gottesmanbacteria bacterium]
MDSIIGLDIGSHSIKLVEIGRRKDEAVLMAAGSIPTPPKALLAVNPEDLESIASVVKKLWKETGAITKNVNIALPESQVFTRVIEVPQLSDRELTSAIKWEAEQYIPLPLDQVTVDFTILREARETGTNKMDVLLVASPKTLVEKYVTILELAELTPVAVETEIIAASRSLIRSTSSVRTVMIVSLGAQTTDLAILRNGIFSFTRSISSGGEALSRAVAQAFGFEISQAEEFKKTYGIEKDKLEGKLLTAVSPIMDTIINEMKRAVAYYQEKYKEENIGVAIISGGTAKVPGMVVYMAEKLGIEVQLANPWIGIVRDPRFHVLDAEGPVFSVAVGLAFR